MIETKNGEPFESFDDKRSYIQELSAYDFQSFNKAYSDVCESFGIDRKFISECTTCHAPNEVEAIIPPDFFRLV
jgi:hypothetical protein